MTAHPRYTWVPYVAAAAGAVLSLKAVLVTATDNGAPSAMAVLYFGGILLGLVAAVGAGLRQHGAARRIGVALGGALLLLIWIMGLGSVLKPLVQVFTDDVNAAIEMPILIAGLVLLGLAWAARSRDLRSDATPVVPDRVQA